MINHCESIAQGDQVQVAILRSSADYPRSSPFRLRLVRNCGLA
ncbi:MAG: hypothetical protein OJF52_000174 [Nitrospira sp.]|nr:MAG: hypothetical protein OJF52_000174 [Nitrospira sp.]